MQNQDKVIYSYIRQYNRRRRRIKNIIEAILIVSSLLLVVLKGQSLNGASFIFPLILLVFAVIINIVLSEGEYSENKVEVVFDDKGILFKKEDGRILKITYKDIHKVKVVDEDIIVYGSFIKEEKKEDMKLKIMMKECYGLLSELSNHGLINGRV